MIVPGLLVLAVLVAPWPAVTVHGARRRGGSWPTAVASGLLFPVTWTVWYLRDVPARRGSPRARPRAAS